jgi:CelD/BcsL family acetyltransferase involved in cellulose biosynthesis
MNAKNDALQIELIVSDEAFGVIKDEWDQLTEKSVNSSFYATYPFIYTAWKHFRTENDQLFILAVRRGATLVGIAPFRIERVKLGNICLIRGIQLRVIRFIAEWGNGDKPSIVTTEEPERIWDSIFQFLCKEFTQWDEIWLAEQPADSPVLNQRVCSNTGFSMTVVPSVISFYMSLTGTWEEYLKTRGKNTYRTWKNSRKKLFALPEGVIFHQVEDPESIPGALKKFIAIEQSGWKKDRDFSVGGSEKNKRFYEELLVQSALKNRAAIYLLTSGTADIGGMIVYKNSTTVYGAQVAYSPMYAEYSPGVILNAEIITTLFGTQYKEYDFLGFQTGDEKNTLKKKWSTGSRQTITIVVNKRNFCMELYTNGKRLKTTLRNAVRMLNRDKQSERAKVKGQ